MPHWYHGSKADSRSGFKPGQKSEQTKRLKIALDSLVNLNLSHSLISHWLGCTLGFYYSKTRSTQ